MKIYTMTMRVPEGSDEFWEDIDKMSAKNAKASLKRELISALQDYGWFDVEIKMGKVIKD